MNDQKLSEDNALSFVLHQDNLMWSRIQTMEAVQLATLGASYAVKSSRPFAIGIIVLGAALTLLVFGLLRRDEMVRQKIHKAIPGLDWSVPRKWYAPLTGRETTWVLCLVLVAADLTMALAIWFNRL